MTKDENPIKSCWYCKKYFDGNFEINNLQIICPYCKRPQSSVFEKKSMAEIIKKSKAGIKKSKAAFIKKPKSTIKKSQS
ncbi:MAG: hypothetical protein ABII22_04425 [Candidatus Micrarchaeota archaeon]